MGQDLRLRDVSSQIVLRYTSSARSARAVRHRVCAYGTTRMPVARTSTTDSNPNTRSCVKHATARYRKSTCDAALRPPVSQKSTKPFFRSSVLLSRSAMAGQVARDVRVAARSDTVTLELANESVHTAARCRASARQQDQAQRVYASNWTRRGAGRRRRRAADGSARARRRRSTHTSCRPRGVRLLSPYR